jgi:hypothetical protein
LHGDIKVHILAKKENRWEINHLSPDAPLLMRKQPTMSPCIRDDMIYNFIKKKKTTGVLPLNQHIMLLQNEARGEK